MAFQPVSLRVEATDGVEEYRLWDGQVQVRTVQGSPEDEPADAWRQLRPDELSAHVQKNTAVAQWLKHRLGWRQLLRACIEPEVLQEFGIAEQAPEQRAA